MREPSILFSVSASETVACLVAADASIMAGKDRQPNC